MNKVLFGASAVFLVGAWMGSYVLQATAVSPAPSDASVVEAAQAVLKALDDEGRKKASFDLDDKERFNWHFIPRPRKGVPLSEMSDAQKAKMKKLLEVSLSEVGVKTVEEVRELETILAEIEGPGRRFPRDPNLYYISIFGKPAKDGRWGWRFEGHHLCLNFTLDGEKVLSATPLMFGANPAIVRSGPEKGLRVLAGVEDVARALMKSLDEAQLKQALGKGKPEEVKHTRSPRYDSPLPAGLSGAKLDREQRRLLVRLLNEYTKHLRDDMRQAIRSEARENGVGKIYIAWRGSLEPYEGHSYMVHSPTFVVSYANFQNGAAHVHSAFRDTTGEFGLK